MAHIYICMLFRIFSNIANSTDFGALKSYQLAYEWTVLAIARDNDDWDIIIMNDNDQQLCKNDTEMQAWVSKSIRSIKLTRPTY